MSGGFKMGYFPFFMEMERSKGVIVGGGKVAARKVEKLIPFGPALTVIAPEIDGRIMQLQKMLQHRADEKATLALECRKAAAEDLEGASFVIAATDEEAVNAWVFAYCKSKKIPVNVVDDREKCTFFFPALVKDGPLTIGISTEGKSPAAAAFVRKEIEQKMPEGLGRTIDMLGMLREDVKKVSEDQSVRAGILEKLFFYCLRREGEVSLSELRELLHGMK